MIKHQIWTTQFNSYVLKKVRTYASIRLKKKESYTSHGMRLCIIDPLQASTKLIRHITIFYILILLISKLEEAQCIKRLESHVSSSSLYDLNHSFGVSGGALKTQSGSLKGGIKKVKDFKMEPNKNSPVAQSTAYMAGAMALHFFGYEFTRSANLALFTSSTMGFSGLSALPFAMAFVSPCSFLLLSWYGKQLEERGPKVALRMTSLLCVCTIGISAFMIWMMDALLLYQTYPMMSKTMVWLSYVFQNSYAHLLYTQHWSFIGSVLNQGQGAKWFASIAGISSIASTIGGSSASQLTNILGLAGLMFMTSLSLFGSTLLGESAYILSEKVNNYGYISCLELCCIIIHLFYSCFGFSYKSMDFNQLKKQKKIIRQRSKVR